MPVFNVSLERTVTSRESGHIRVEATNLGEAERLARAKVKAGAPLEARWRAQSTEVGHVVVVDVEEAAAPGSKAA